MDGQVVLRDGPEDVEPTDKSGRSDARNKVKTSDTTIINRTKDIK